MLIRDKPTMSEKKHIKKGIKYWDYRTRDLSSCVIKKLTNNFGRINQILWKL